MMSRIVYHFKDRETLTADTTEYKTWPELGVHFGVPVGFSITYYLGSFTTVTGLRVFCTPFAKDGANGNILAAETGAAYVDSTGPGGRTLVWGHNGGMTTFGDGLYFGLKLNSGAWGSVANVSYKLFIAVAS